MKKRYLLVAISFLLLVVAFLYNPKHPEIQESITFFPIDPNVSYKTVHTSLTLLTKPTYTLLWRADSILDRKAYLRQDVGLLFSNGRLIATLGDWKQNTAAIGQEKRIPLDQSALFQAISYHHAELHEEGERIFSSQAMSADRLFVVSLSPVVMHSFRTPKTEEERKGEQFLNEQTQRMLQLSWNKGVRHFSILLKNYQAYPLSQFNEKAKDVLPGYSKAGTAKIVGNLWEGLYKNYFLGIKKADGTNVSAIGSTIPLILLAKNKSHLLVLTETANGEPIVLRQQLINID